MLLAWKARLGMFSVSHGSFSISHYKKASSNIYSILEIFPLFSLSVLPSVDYFPFHSYLSWFLTDFFSNGMGQDSLWTYFLWVMTLGYFPCFTAYLRCSTFLLLMNTVLLLNPTLAWLNPPCLSCLPTFGWFISVSPEWKCIGMQKNLSEFPCIFIF